MLVSPTEYISKIPVDGAAPAMPRREATRILCSSVTLLLAACGPVDDGVPAKYRGLAVPSARLESPDTRERGRLLFAAHCALCHGPRGDGRGLRRSALERPPRDFSDPAWRLRASPRRVFVAIREGLPRTPMPAWRSLSDDETWDLVAYVLSIATAGPDPATRHWERLVENIGKGDVAIFNAPVFLKGEQRGFGFHEAPRGTLSHWVVIEDGKIANPQAVVPSTWNAGPSDDKDQPGPYEASLVGNSIADLERPLEVLRTIHSFDPCLACSIQAVDVEGRELSRVRALQATGTRQKALCELSAGGPLRVAAGCSADFLSV